MGHLELFEANLCRFLGIEHNSELLQLPVAPFLDSVGLGSFICGVYTLLGCSRIDHFVGLSQQDLAKLGMDNQQACSSSSCLFHLPNSAVAAALLSNQRPRIEADSVFPFWDWFSDG
jgi:hypothetical protein